MGTGLFPSCFPVMGSSYDKPFYLILNIAVGGLGGPVAQEALPFVMEVGYVRVYQKKRRKLK